MSELNQEVETNDQVPVEASSEEKFFGVKTKIVKKEKLAEKKDESDIELEVVDDRPVDDRRPAKSEESEASSNADEDELAGYSEKVQKRINKLRYEQNEERRQREAAERMRDEAVRVTQTLNNKNQEYESIIQRGESALVGQIKAKAEMTLENAKSVYKKAYEEGDTDTVVNSQEALYKAQAELAEAQKYETNINNHQAQLAQQAQYNQQFRQQAPQQPAQQAPQVDPEAKEWADKNKWFMAPDSKRMTATAYGLHEEAIVDNGIKPNTHEYFEFIDKGMRESYPTFDWQDTSDTNGRNAPATANQRSTVVASSNRNNGAKPRKVQLTSTQVSLARKLGITPEQYARQLAKENLK
tara:strand:- start:17 stop:1081 length:1065 start_codon:yes stop_codon:yes gene_type:complete